ncbi:Hua1p NDAI_0B00790 [Naumovozyma dairenensis CBS 421]|uniref:Proline-rich protein HUA1 n=1 Tax=Naumovozyma dairenensis (strain ATCC 10597 / BCRC 20456 / CBS 421 / NBRC 0211 / NRRL Y-12639) TaxID=1071378 RepID=G0W5Q2_NAUDC|nr:hypothetical protein NDAI_0B00790 [Naumovozyma dairenensis CBS 421]CCD23113.1 hypothetical protein NDAI_0B00790 [Naumovozyma dairenensis CBS 421]
MSKIPDDNDGLPSYEDVINEEERLQQQQQQQQQNSRPRPPPIPSNNRPSTSIRPPPLQPARPSPRPPASHPTQQGDQRIKPSNYNPSIPWTYPAGFHCKKCNNTGYKLKNGHSCKSCWRRFAPSNNTMTMPTTYNAYYQNGSNPFFPFAGAPPTPSFMPHVSVGPTPPIGPNGVRPLMVQPGDPRLGGVICGECRGSGRIRFLLDDDLCPLCNGLGRIIGRRP